MIKHDNAFMVNLLTNPKNNMQSPYARYTPSAWKIKQKAQNKHNMLYAILGVILFIIGSIIESNIL